MGLKDEIDKLIQAERKKLAIEVEKRAEFEKHQLQRLEVMWTLLEEIRASIDENYLSMFYTGQAVAHVDVGIIKEGLIDLQFQIFRTTNRYFGA